MLTCAKTGRKFRPTAGQGWYQQAPHKPGTTLLMAVVHPDEVRSGRWVPTDFAGEGPAMGRCGILEKV